MQSVFASPISQNQLASPFQRGTGGDAAKPGATMPQHRRHSIFTTSLPVLFLWSLKMQTDITQKDIRSYMIKTLLERPPADVYHEEKVGGVDGMVIARGSSST